ncbi:uncharacterized protein LOC122651083 [Telopea speciosissima]|uniref:uncharacterized protein LOC122651083 n=1 Tax=Telopea speciosissima TaxID=54955 RepID=UPI001CC490A2|nr:uncharacterized protein LOC122651083 [Telopea speciosissima]
MTVGNRFIRKHLRYAPLSIGICVTISSSLQPPLWNPPPPSVYKLNCDASIIKDKQLGGLGFLIRDHLGACKIVAVSNPIACDNVLIDKAMAIKEGLLEAISEGAYSLIVESDNMEVILFLKSCNSRPTLQVRSIINDFRHLQSLFDNCIFQFIPRAASFVADALARRALSLTSKMV